MFYANLEHITHRAGHNVHAYSLVEAYLQKTGKVKKLREPKIELRNSEVVVNYVASIIAIRPHHHIPMDTQAKSSQT